eukprot:TRINITY_DN4300_c0_g1_i3.p1 TRINITY_DN4300_c0_g1~~TRINITY_DN4300_c0_g1_i3.p1  ORF type:complete len:541 (-),score=97.29 TRINITY_DN4300_c0_g1_i3:80-1654(-)
MSDFREAFNREKHISRSRSSSASIPSTGSKIKESSSSSCNGKYSQSTLDAAKATQKAIEKYYTSYFKSLEERQKRRLQYEQKMEDLKLSESGKEERRKKLDQIETQYIRARRIRLNKDTFKTIKIIGRGSFGEVRLVQMNGTKKLYAMKKLKKSKMIERNQVAHVKAERDALASLNDFYKENPWVVRLYYSFQDALYLYLIMEYVPGGDLMSQLIKYEVFTEDETRFYIAQLVMAVDSIHKFGYIHRDVKPDNILLDRQGHIKLSDFGLCTGFTEEIVQNMQSKFQTYKTMKKNSSFKEHKNSNYMLDDQEKESKEERFNSWKQKRRRAFSEVGTPDYMAPEVLNSGNGYGEECDWWSVGVIMFEMLAGFPCFYSSSTEESSSSTFQKIMDWENTLKDVFEEVQLNPDAKDLILRFLSDRSKRIGRNGVEEIQSHPFFSKLNGKWGILRRLTAPIIPIIEHPLDTQHFPHLSDEEEDREEEEVEKGFPVFKGRRLRKTDIPFIGFTYKNLAAVPSLILPPKTAH